MAQVSIPFLTTAFAPILQYPVDFLKRKIGYVFKYKRNVAKLKDQVEKLTGARENLQHSVDNAIRNGEEIHKDVQKWLCDSDKAIEVAQEVIRGEELAQKCFIVRCPNLKRRYQVGRKAAKEASAIVDLTNEGKFERGQISHRSAPPQIVASSVNGFEGLPSRASILKEVMDSLADHSVNMIGVYGLPGTGKTTLAKEVHKQAIERELYNVVVMAEVSEKPDLEKIQGKIADVLGMKLEAETVDGRANQLHLRLKKEEKMLIILDDLRARIELEAVGIPFGNDHKGCKILLTSRKLDVLSNEMNAQKNLKLDILSEEEAWGLFEKTVGGDKSLKLPPIAAEVAKKCAGLPLSIVTVARCLKNKGMHVWQDALRRLSNVDNQGMQAKVYSALEWTFDRLVGDEVKSLFLLCGVIQFPNIRIQGLLIYSIGLNLFKDVHGVEDARIRLLTSIDELKASCFLEDGDDNGFVKMHDIVRDFALSLASRAQHVAFIKAPVGVKGWAKKLIPDKCTRISLWCENINDLPGDLQYPELEFLQVEGDQSLKIPDSFFSGLRKLKVLDCIGMSLSFLPSSIAYLTNLHTLCLGQCILHNITIIGELKKLEILSLRRSDIAELPSEIGQLTALKLLDLGHCTNLEVIPKNVISQLSLLEELYMGNSFIHWDVQRPDNYGNASLSELECLCCLTNLEIHVLDAQKLPKGPFFKRLERYRMFIGDEWDWDCEFHGQKTLKLKPNNESILKQRGIKTLLKETEELYLDEVKGIKNVLYYLDGEGFPHLKYLHIQNGSEIQYILESGNWVAFPVLESLFLCNLMDLEKICQGRLGTKSFSELQVLIVRNCKELKNLFSFSMVKALSKLREMEVMDCNKMEAIFIDENEDADDRHEVAVFTKLCSLKLKLPQLSSFCSRVEVPSTSQTAQAQSVIDTEFQEILPECDVGYSLPFFEGKVVFPNLEEAKLLSVKLDMLWHKHAENLSTSIVKLKSLIVEDCRNLKCLFPSSMVKSLVQLRRLEICDCNSMEEIVGEEGSGAGEMIRSIHFPKLEFLKLSGLPKLIRFCGGNLIACPALKELWIKNCPRLDKFISNSVGEDVAANSNRENLNTILFDEKVEFPNLEELRILSMDRLEMIWHDELHENSFCKLRSLTVENGKGLMRIFPPTILKRFHNLEKLDIDGCDSLEVVFDVQVLRNVNEGHSETITRMRTMYLWNLPNLKHVWNNNPQGILSFENLRTMSVRMCPSLKNLFPASVAENLLQLEYLYISHCGVEEIVAMAGGDDAAPRFMFPKLTSLELFKLPKLDKFYPAKHTTEWSALTTLSVLHCEELKLFDFESHSLEEQEGLSEIQIRRPLFSIQEVVPKLEQLPLTSTDAKTIMEGQYPLNLFDKIKALILKYFRHDFTVLPCDVLKIFPTMERLAASDCNFKVLFSYDEVLGRDDATWTLARIRHLKLDFLPDLEQMWNMGSELDPVLPTLETLEVWSCDKLINLVPPSDTFHSLKTLHVWDCHGLVKLVTPSTAKSLKQLTSLTIGECSRLREVVANGGGEAGDEIIFRRLLSLELHSLPSLTSFCSGYQKFRFPSLTEVTLRQCPKMQVFTEGALSTPKLQSVKLTQEDERGRWYGNLNATVQQLFIGHLIAAVEQLLSEMEELGEMQQRQAISSTTVSAATTLTSAAQPTVPVPVSAAHVRTSRPKSRKWNSC